MKRIRLASLLTAVLLLTGCGAAPSSSSTASPADTQPAETTAAAPAAEETLTVTFLKCGKADAMLLQTDTHAVVIDCGEKSDGSKMVDLLNAQGVKTIDCMILTHYDQDHIGGAAKVVKKFDVQEIIASDYEEDSSEYEKLTAAMADKDLTFTIPEDPLTFTVGDLLLEVCPHENTDYADGFDNNCSIVTKVTHGSNVLLFTGDAMQERLEEIMDIGTCDLLKVPYHGRSLDNLGTFLDAVKPTYAVISTSQDELASSTLEALSSRKIVTYATCLHGTVTAVSDGKSLTVTAAGPDT